MNRRDLKNFWSLTELLEEDSEEGLMFAYMDDMSEDIKNK